MDWQEIEYQVFDSSKTKSDGYHFYKENLLYSFDQNNNIYQLIFLDLYLIKMFYRKDRSK